MCLLKQCYGYPWTGEGHSGMCVYAGVRGDPAIHLCFLSSLISQTSSCEHEFTLCFLKRLGNNYFRIELEFIEMFFE